MKITRRLMRRPEAGDMLPDTFGFACMAIMLLFSRNKLQRRLARCTVMPRLCRQYFNPQNRILLLTCRCQMLIDWNFFMAPQK